VDNTVAPVVDDAVAPVVDNAVAPVVDNAVAPIVDNAVAPVVDNAVAPVVDNAVTSTADDVADVAEGTVDDVVQEVSDDVVEAVDEGLVDAADDVVDVTDDVIGLNNSPLVTNKFPDEALDPVGKIFGEVQPVNGRVTLEGKSVPRNVDFVITQDNRLIIGSKHTTLSNGADVKAAGGLKIDGAGRIRRIDNGSGHFRPTVGESLLVPDLLKSLGLNVEGARFLAYEYTINSKGLITSLKAVVNKVLD
jgi:hypothetical protein